MYRDSRVCNKQVFINMFIYQAIFYLLSVGVHNKHCLLIDARYKATNCNETDSIGVFVFCVFY